MKYNKILSKNFLHSLFWKQNEWHRHGVFLHTVKVFWHTLTDSQYKMLAAALFHDIGKPFIAYQKDKDIKDNQYSFTDHEEASYQIIKNWPFLSDYTKKLVRYHYLFRDIDKHKIKDPLRSQNKKKVWDSLSIEFQNDLKIFIVNDDKGKV